MDATIPSRRWLRFSLRGALILIAVIAVLIWIPIQRAKTQKRAVDEIHRLGGTVQYDGTEPESPGWLRSLLGKDYFRSVVVVSFRDLNIIDRDLECLSGLPSVEYLNLSRCKSLTAASLAHIGTLRNLRVLDLSFTKIANRGLNELRNHSHIQVLELADTAVSDIGMADLATIVSLINLNLSCSDVSDNGLKSLAEAKSIQQLDLADTPYVSDTGLMYVGKMKNLTELNLRGDRRVTSSSITDAGLAALDDLTKLKGLRFESYKLTDHGVQHLLKHPALELLQVSHSGLTDAGLAELAALTNLDHLYLDNTDVTDAGLLQLKSFPKLTYVVLGGRNMTDAGIDRLRKLLPQLKIVESAVLELRPTP